MLTHGQIWTAIDRLAADHGLSASALAKKAGLDATAFNRSKRITPDGRPRWPSTESLAKVLAATGSSVEDFMALLVPGLPVTHGGFAEEAPARAMRPIPHIGLAQAGAGGFFDDAGFPVGGGWDEILFPEVEDEHAYALEIAGESMLPVYRPGDLVVVSPSASVRKGDRVVVKTREGEVLAKELVRQTHRTVELRSLNPDYEDRALAVKDVAWIARIMWASQ
ncbi:S24 family peptidase [Xanthobacteraceae bacterium A53D]